MTKTKSAMTMGRALLLGGALMAFAAPALAQSPMSSAAPDPSSPLQVHAMASYPALNLSASGEVKVAPDMATITFGVVTEAATAQEEIGRAHV